MEAKTSMKEPQNLTRLSDAQLEKIIMDMGTDPVARRAALDEYMRAERE